MLTRITGEDVQLVLGLAQDVGRVSADAGQLEQALTNLVVNARDATPRGGRITISTANVTLDADAEDLRLGETPGDYVMLSVTDTGTGMTDEVKEHLFEPFYTTKPVGKGTGLGLATVFGIVKQHQGNIHVYSELGQGTCFKIYLPRVQEAERRRAKAQTTTVPRGSETVLVVEDDPLVRSLACSILTRLGYHVLQASQGDEALTQAQSHAERIHLLLSDVIMPGMPCAELARRLRALHPEAKVLFTSGYTDDRLSQAGNLSSGAPFLAKPYSLDSLARKVREALDGTAGATPAT